MKIKVTQEEIDDGVATVVSNCPIALALRKQFPKAKVTDEGITLDGTWKDERKTPEEAVKFINEFDRGISVEPFEFDLPD